jgi:hypothetical protein
MKLLPKSRRLAPTMVISLNGMLLRMIAITIAKQLTYLICCALTCISASTAFAKPYYGGTSSIPLLTKEPQSLRGGQFMLVYDPQRFKWKQFDVYFDGGYSYFAASGTPNYTGLAIYSVAPILRYSFKQQRNTQAFLELSVGVAYLNHTHLQYRNLGIHFAFQDRVGAGLLFGTDKQFLVGLHAVHYSNAHLSSHNSGITIPLEFDIGYRFS